mmetsp:Transcript_24171/g.53605  ORF Transcript_24171/g.53605 Transcript_24171/m.53605 type:complete len:343 (+) Transcript_24171:43-1071(+)|eukprot:CAMPEP_0170609854 /NCGR_PEP_ID=MMETSP0224-20130122/22342_1 /TAXON_ID=285029 /ORGANISM="Togula jolla, Strain CCCM 725" /LENGTH=342 /DNA_ID=CAMNT_0010935179 /DNA_START=42 /DNA_END=1070 /DNA_ORIENTATION=-
MESLHTYLACSLALLASLGAGTPQLRYENNATADFLEANSKLDSANYYIFTRQDAGNCSSPLCGGFFVKGLNVPLTKCFDGASAPDCYVAELNVSTLGSPDAEQVQQFIAQFLSGSALVRGDLEPFDMEQFPMVPRLVVSEAWSGATGNEPWGQSWLLADTSIRCATTPCLYLEGSMLNEKKVQALAGVDLESLTGGGRELSQRGYEELTQRNIIAAGTLELVEGQSGKAQIFVASEWYTQISVIFCTEDEQCGEKKWCRQLQGTQESACTPFAQLGDMCEGFTLPWLFQRCAPDLICQTPDSSASIADLSGICQVPEDVKDASLAVPPPRRRLRFLPFNLR